MEFMEWMGKPQFGLEATVQELPSFHGFHKFHDSKKPIRKKNL